MDLKSYLGQKVTVRTYSNLNPTGILRKIGPVSITLELYSRAEFQVRLDDIIRVAEDAQLPKGYNSME